MITRWQWKHPTYGWIKDGPCAAAAALCTYGFAVRLGTPEGEEEPDDKTEEVQDSNVQQPEPEPNSSSPEEG